MANKPAPKQRKTKVAARRKVSVKKVGSSKKGASGVKHTNSHNHPAKPGKGGNKSGVVNVKQGVNVIEYRGEGKRHKDPFGGVPVVGSRG